MCKNRILFYSHDAYGMGNIRRTLAICDRLTREVPDLSVLILTGSPVIHALRIPRKVDYIKLPCLTRDKRETFSPKFWNMSLKELMRFRSELILSSIKSFCPNIVIVDKKPLGIKREFLHALQYLKNQLPETRIILGLRDILDEPATTIPIWKTQRYYDIIKRYYHHVWIYGSPKVFNTVQEYQMPQEVAEKAVFTGYLGRTPGNVSRARIRSELGVNGSLLSLVMVGGGGDGYPIMKAYMDGLRRNGHLSSTESLLVCGPEMPRDQRREVEHFCSNGIPAAFKEFSDEMENLLAAADVVVSMGGYNSICEILSFRKKAVIVPRVSPVKEQLIRTKRLAELGLVNMLHPAELTPESLMKTVERTSSAQGLCADVDRRIDLNGLQRIVEMTQEMLMVAA
ncbi:MAG: glycosyltransferase [Calditrichaeota bacterium]|nr:MAG: glycosyltransferase [Calditrichota bacterium]